MTSDQGSFFEGSTPRPPQLPDLTPSEHARTADPSTSHRAAARTFGRKTQMAQLLVQYRGNADRGGLGLIDEEAADLAAIRGGWKRCSDLRNAGMIAPTGAERKSSSGSDSQVCLITDLGRRTLAGMDL